MSTFFSDKKEDIKEAVQIVNSLPIPAFSDVAKATNDLIGKDFYHLAAGAIEVKSKVNSGVTFVVKGRSAHDNGPISGSLEAKKADKPNGTTGTITWTSANAIDLKLELEDNMAKGLKAEVIGSVKPDSSAYGAKLNLTFKQPQFHSRAFIDLVKGPTANMDVVLSQQGFLVGGAVGYDVQKAALTTYSAVVGYQAPQYSTAITANNGLSTFTASYFHKVSSAVQAGAKATYDSKNAGVVGLEVASKYMLDPLSFFKAKVNDKGLAALAYNTKVNSGFTFGIGASFDTQKLNEATHKVGAHFVFEA